MSFSQSASSPSCSALTFHCPCSLMRVFFRPTWPGTVSSSSLPIQTKKNRASDQNSGQIRAIFDQWPEFRLVARISGLVGTLLINKYALLSTRQLTSPRCGISYQKQRNNSNQGVYCIKSNVINLSNN